MDKIYERFFETPQLLSIKVQQPIKTPVQPKSNFTERLSATPSTISKKSPPTTNSPAPNKNDITNKIFFLDNQVKDFANKHLGHVNYSHSGNINTMLKIPDKSIKPKDTPFDSNFPLLMAMQYDRLSDDDKFKIGARIS